jgi:hypothetical protein
MPKFFIAYHIFVSKYFATLCPFSFPYHDYAKNFIGSMIIWHYGESFGTSSGHFTFKKKRLGLPLIV